VSEPQQATLTSDSSVSELVKKGLTEDVIDNIFGDSDDEKPNEEHRRTPSPKTSEPAMNSLCASVMACKITAKPKEKGGYEESDEDNDGIDDLDREDFETEKHARVDEYEDHENDGLHEGQEENFMASDDYSDYGIYKVPATPRLPPGVKNPGYDTDHGSADPNVYDAQKDGGYFLGEPINKIFVDDIQSIAKLSFDSIKSLYQWLDMYDEKTVEADLDFDPNDYLITKPDEYLKSHPGSDETMYHWELLYMEEFVSLAAELIEKPKDEDTWIDDILNDKGMGMNIVFLYVNFAIDPVTKYDEVMDLISDDDYQTIVSQMSWSIPGHGSPGYEEAEENNKRMYKLICVHPLIMDHLENYKFYRDPDAKLPNGVKILHEYPGDMLRNTEETRAQRWQAAQGIIESANEVDNSKYITKIEALLRGSGAKVDSVLHTYSLTENGVTRINAKECTVVEASLQRILKGTISNRTELVKPGLKRKTDEPVIPKLDIQPTKNKHHNNNNKHKKKGVFQDSSSSPDDTNSEQSDVGQVSGGYLTEQRHIDDRVYRPEQRNTRPPIANSLSMASLDESTNQDADQYYEFNADVMSADETPKNERKRLKKQSENEDKKQKKEKKHKKKKDEDTIIVDSSDEQQEYAQQEDVSDDDQVTNPYLDNIAGVDKDADDDEENENEYDSDDPFIDNSEVNDIYAIDEEDQPKPSKSKTKGKSKGKK